MKKSFIAFMLENDMKEHVYYVKSIYNIFNKEVMDSISLILTPYDMIDVKKMGFIPIQQYNEWFPDFPNTPTYSLKVTTGMELDVHGIAQSISTFARINDDGVLVHKDGQKPEDLPDVKGEGTGEPVGDEEIRDMVGDRRVGAFIKELIKDKDIRGSGEVRGVYESFCVPHTEISKLTDHSVGKGFYIVEHHEDSLGVGTVTGPFRKQPMNYEFVSKLSKSKVLSESHEDNRVIMKIKLTESPEEIYEMRKWEVEVMDTDSGQTYDVVVDAKSSVDARNLGISIISKRIKKNPSQFIATKPE